MALYRFILSHLQESERSMRSVRRVHSHSAAGVFLGKNGGTNGNERNRESCRGLDRANLLQFHSHSRPSTESDLGRGTIHRHDVD